LLAGFEREHPKFKDIVAQFLATPLVYVKWTCLHHNVLR